jgi:hypothetical protein
MLHTVLKVNNMLTTHLLSFPSVLHISSSSNIPPVRRSLHAWCQIAANWILCTCRVQVNIAFGEAVFPTFFHGEQVLAAAEVCCLPLSHSRTPQGRPAVQKSLGAAVSGVPSTHVELASQWLNRQGSNQHLNGPSTGASMTAPSTLPHTCGARRGHRRRRRRRRWRRCLASC